MIFENPNGIEHTKPLYVKMHVNGKPVGRVLVDNGSTINVILMQILPALMKKEEDMIYTNLTIIAVIRGITNPLGVLPLEITMGTKTCLETFFVIKSTVSYKIFLGRDGVHTSLCMSSSLHQCLLFWNGDQVETITVDANHSKLRSIW